MGRRVHCSIAQYAFLLQIITVLDPMNDMHLLKTDIQYETHNNVDFFLFMQRLVNTTLNKFLHNENKPFYH